MQSWRKYVCSLDWNIVKYAFPERKSFSFSGYFHGWIEKFPFRVLSSFLLARPENIRKSHTAFSLKSVNFSRCFHEILWVSQTFPLNMRKFPQTSKTNSHSIKNIFRKTKEFFITRMKFFCTSKEIIAFFKEFFWIQRRKYSSISKKVARIFPKFSSHPNFYPNILLVFPRTAFIKKLFRFVCSTSFFFCCFFYLECQLKNENASDSLHEKLHKWTLRKFHKIQASLSCC